MNDPNQLTALAISITTLIFDFVFVRVVAFFSGIPSYICEWHEISTTCVDSVRSYYLLYKRVNRTSPYGLFPLCKQTKNKHLVRIKVS